MTPSLLKGRPFGERPEPMQRSFCPGESHFPASATRPQPQALLGEVPARQNCIRWAKAADSNVKSSPCGQGLQAMRCCSSPHVTVPLPPLSYANLTSGGCTGPLLTD